MRFHEVVVTEIERDRSFKVFQLFAECVCQAREAAANRVTILRLAETHDFVVDGLQSVQFGL